MKNAVQLSQHLLSPLLKDSIQVVVDGTLGNGHDLGFIINTFPTIEKAYGFDIQLDAIQSAIKRLSPPPDGLTLNLIHDSHLNLTKHIPLDLKVDLFIYNLGYLPGGDKSITTQVNTVIESLECALQYLKIKSVMSIVCYPGHESGKIELDGILQWARKLNQKTYTVTHHQFINQVNHPPELIIIQQTSDRRFP